MKIEDSLDVATIHALSWQHTYKGIVDQGFLDSLDIQKRAENWRRGVAANDPPLIRLVAESDGRLIAFACGLDNRTKNETPSCDAELWAIYVHPEHLNRGAGKALLKQFMAELRSAGRSRLCVWALKANSQARKFYEKQGGVLSAVKDVKIGDQMLPEVGYEFQL